MKKLALHWKILIGMVLGIAFGFAMTSVDNGKEIILDWVAPFGTIFVKMLKLIAVPLILASLIKGISDLKDISKFKNIGIRTIVTYILTTVVAITIGLALVTSLKPGEGISQTTVDKLYTAYGSDEGLLMKLKTAEAQKDKRPLQFVEDMVPDNITHAFSDNGLMLQVIFFTIFFAIAMLLVGEKKVKPIKDFFDALNDIVLKMVDLIMLFAPYAVFALLATVVVNSKDPDLLVALLKYAFVVFLGLILMIVFYTVVFSSLTKKNPFWFLSKISPAQLLAFSTSSSAATLPVTMERLEEHIGVDKEVSSFVLPVGATINMDGTSLYQAVAAVFICQTLGFDLATTDYFTIGFTALLASIGSAAVPGAGMVMLVVVMNAINVPSEMLVIGLALVYGVDRPLDMCRTVVNVTGDATVASIIAKALGKLHEPQPKEWDDHYDAVK